MFQKPFPYNENVLLFLAYGGGYRRSCSGKWRSNEKLMGLVSVVIPNYNGEKYLRDCLDALLKQGYAEYEVIIVDNGSEDSDYMWIKQSERITFKRLSENYGFSKAVNEGIKMAKGEYVLLLNNDTVVQSDFIKALVEAIEKDDRIFGVSSKMIAYQNHEIMDDAGDEYTLMGWAYKNGDGKPVQSYEKEKKVFSACGGAALYRKKVFDEIGYFDEHFFAYVEDVDISYRARIFGYYNVYCPKAKVYHIGSATSGSRYNEFKVKLAARNNLYVQYKNMPFFQLLINLPAILMGWLVKYMWFSKKGYGQAFKEGFKEGIHDFAHLDKVKFKWKHFIYYIVIEVLLIKNGFLYVGSKLKKFMKKLIGKSEAKSKS